jgi:hypothetical protein
LGLLAEMIAAQTGRGTDNYSILEETGGSPDGEPGEAALVEHSSVPDHNARSGDV